LIGARVWYGDCNVFLEIGDSSMPQSVQTPDSRILWPPQHSPATSKVFAQNTIETEEAWRGLLLFFLGPRTRRLLLTSHQEWRRALKELAEAS
jgi:hypothetical protein